MDGAYLSWLSRDSQLQQLLSPTSLPISQLHPLLIGVHRPRQVVRGGLPWIERLSGHVERQNLRSWVFELLEGVWASTAGQLRYLEPGSKAYTEI